MNSNLPLVSVIVPAYNAAAFIEQTLDCVLSQTYKNIEVLVIDDGSQDRTTEIVEFIAQRNRRVILLQQSNAGVAAARNLGIKKSRGEYIAPIDADDIWYPQKLEKQVQCILQSDASVGLVYTWSVTIDEEGLIIGKYYNHNFHDLLTIHSLQGKIYPGLVYRNVIGNASVPLIRRACLEQVGYYNTELRDQGAQGCEDWDISLRIAEYYQVWVVPEFLVGYRQVTGSMSENYESMSKSYSLIMAEVQQRHPEIPNTIYRWSSSFFYTYLAGKSSGCGNHWSTLIFLYKALQVDFKLCLWLGLYKWIVICFLKIAAKPVTSLIWQDHNSWLQYRQRFKANHQVMTIDDINTQMNQPQQPLWKLSDRLMLRRWHRVVQLCRTVSPEAKKTKNS